MKIKIACLVVSIITMGGCAKRPDAIVPVDIPMAAYSNNTCKQIADELVHENTVLAAMSKSQNQAATGDVVGVFLIGVPLSSMSGGDKEGNIAVSKGKVLALQNASKANGC